MKAGYVKLNLLSRTFSREGKVRYSERIFTIQVPSDHVVFCFLENGVDYFSFADFADRILIKISENSYMEI